METPDRIEVYDGGGGVRLEWPGGICDEISASDLRRACPCASCGEPVGRAAMMRAVEGSVPVTITAAELVGTYAITFTFAPDGHGTGIYPFGVLRRLAAGEPGVR